MSKEVYRRLSKAERKLENTNRLRTSNSTLRIKYEGIKKLLKKKDKEIERLNKRIKELEEGFKASTEDLCEESIKIEKAVEYITSAIENDDIEELKSARHLMLWNEDLDKLLEILGSDKE